MIGAGPARALAEGLIRLCYPPACVFCGAGIAGGRLCRKCRRDMCQTAHANVCWRCAASAGPFAGTAKGCDLCQREKFAFEGVLRLGSYRDSLATACLRAKHVGGLWLCEILADLLFDHRRVQLEAIDVDVVVPVPLHWWRRWRRGYDQVFQVASRLADHLGKPMSQPLVRCRNTPPQSRLPRTARKDNVRGAFRARRRTQLDGAAILLVDDILTTGATAHFSAKALRNAGARQVHVAVIARAEPGAHSPPA